MAGILGSKKNIETFVLTRKPGLWKSKIKVLANIDDELSDEVISEGTVSIVTDSPEKVIPFSDLIVISVPANFRSSILKRISPYVPANCWVGAFPSTGCFDLQSAKYLGDKVRLFGSQKSPYVATVLEYGSLVEQKIQSGKTRALKIAAKGNIEELGEIIENAFNLKTIRLNNFLETTLVTSHPLGNPARLFRLLYNYKEGKYWSKVPMHYREWDDMSSEFYVSLGEEMHSIVTPMAERLNLSQVQTVWEEQGVKSIAELTLKIRKSFKNCRAAFKETPKGWVPNIEGDREFGIYAPGVKTMSRNFWEDIPYGLVVIRSLADLVKVRTPTMDLIITWAQNWLNKQYLVDGTSFSGKDLKDLPIPHNSGLLNLDDLVNYYDLYSAT